MRPVLSAAVGLAASLCLWGTASAGTACDGVVPAAGASKAQQRVAIPSDLVSLRDFGLAYIGGSEQRDLFEISPDHKKFAIQIRRGDPGTNTYCFALLVSELAAPARPVLLDAGTGYTPFDTTNNVNAGVFLGPRVLSPHWSPDGRAIAFLKTVEGVTRVWVVDVIGGKAAIPVTPAGVDVGEFAWTDRGRSIVFSTYPLMTAARRDIETEGLAGFHYDIRFDPSLSAKPIPLGPIPPEIQVVDLANGSIRAAEHGERSGIRLRDDKRILPTVGPSGATAWIAKGADTGARIGDALRVLRPGREERICRSAVCTERVDDLWFGADGSEVFFTRREGYASSETGFYRWDLRGAAPVRLFATQDVLLGCKPLRELMVCAHEASTTPRRLVLLDPRTGRMRELFDPNPEFRELRLGKVERLHWKNEGGLEAFGDLVLPPDHVGGQKHPLIVVQYRTRGFLRGGVGEEYPIQAFAGKGYAVLSFDRPRVAEKYPGETWGAYGKRRYRGWTERRSILSALLAGVDLAIAKGVVDPDRVGITGMSDGATTAQFALVNSNRFHAAALSQCCYEPVTSLSLAGIDWADLVLQYGWPKLSEPDEKYWSSMSLRQNAKALTVPILLQLSDSEFRQGLESFMALREQNAPAELYVFPDEPHDKWQPAHKVAAGERAMDWFDFWLRGLEPTSRTPAELKRWHELKAARTTPRIN